jgi:hypothetical protein
MVVAFGVAMRAKVRRRGAAYIARNHKLALARRGDF